MRNQESAFPSKRDAALFHILHGCGFKQHQIAARFGDFGENPGRVSEVLSGQRHPEVKHIVDEFLRSLDND